MFLVGHGISAVEFDVCSTKNGSLVVAHPGLTNGEVLESATSFADFLKVCSSNRVDVFVDVKFTDLKFDISFLNSVKKKIFEAGIDKQSVIISRSEKVLLQFKDAISTGYITSEIGSELFYPWDMLLSPITNLQKNFIPSGHQKWKLIITDVDIANVKLVQRFNPYAVMTDFAVRIQAWMREKMLTNFFNSHGQ